MPVDVEYCQKQIKKEWKLTCKWRRKVAAIWRLCGSPLVSPWSQWDKRPKGTTSQYQAALDWIREGCPNSGLVWDRFHRENPHRPEFMASALVNAIQDAEYHYGQMQTWQEILRQVCPHNQLTKEHREFAQCAICQAIVPLQK